MKPPLTQLPMLAVSISAALAQSITAQASEALELYLINGVDQSYITEPVSTTLTVDLDGSADQQNLVDFVITHPLDTDLDQSFIADQDGTYSPLYPHLKHVLALPAAYDADLSGGYPLMVFLGDDSTGYATDSTDLIGMSQKLIEQGPWHLASSAFGLQESIVITAQSADGTWGAADLDGLNELITFATANYNVNISKISLCGHQAGAEGAFAYAKQFGGLAAVVGNGRILQLDPDGSGDLIEGTFYQSVAWNEDNVVDINDAYYAADDLILYGYDHVSEIYPATNASDPLAVSADWLFGTSTPNTEFYTWLSQQQRLTEVKPNTMLSINLFADASLWKINQVGANLDWGLKKLEIGNFAYNTHYGDWNNAEETTNFLKLWDGGNGGGKIEFPSDAHFDNKGLNQRLSDYVTDNATEIITPLSAGLVVNPDLGHTETSLTMSGFGQVTTNGAWLIVYFTSHETNTQAEIEVVANIGTAASHWFKAPEFASHSSNNNASSDVLTTGPIKNPFTLNESNSTGSATAASASYAVFDIANGASSLTATLRNVLGGKAAIGGVQLISKDPLPTETQTDALADAGDAVNFRVETATAWSFGNDASRWALDDVNSQASITYELPSGYDITGFGIDVFSKRLLKNDWFTIETSNDGIKWKSAPFVQLKQNALAGTVALQADSWYASTLTAQEILSPYSRFLRVTLAAGIDASQVQLGSIDLEQNYTSRPSINWENEAEFAEYKLDPEGNYIFPDRLLTEPVFTINDPDGIRKVSLTRDGAGFQSIDDFTGTVTDYTYAPQAFGQVNGYYKGATGGERYIPGRDRDFRVDVEDKQGNIATLEFSVTFMPINNVFLTKGENGEADGAADYEIISDDNLKSLKIRAVEYWKDLGNRKFKENAAADQDLVDLYRSKVTQYAYTRMTVTFEDSILYDSDLESEPTWKFEDPSFFNSLPEGTHTVTARMWDERGHLTKRSFTFYRRAQREYSAGLNPYAFTDGENMEQFYARIPDAYFAPENTSKTWPVLFYLHAAGPHFDHIDKFDIENRNPGGLDPAEYPLYDEFILIAPHNRDVFDKWNNPAYVHDLDALLIQLQSELRIDPDRIHISGFSAGAIGATHFVHEYPNRFASLMPLASTHWPSTGSQKSLDLALARVPTFIYVRAEDHHFESATIYYNRVKSAYQEVYGSDVEFHETVSINNTNSLDGPFESFYQGDSHNAYSIWPYENDKDPSLFQKLLDLRRGDLVSNAAPQANAGSDFSVVDMDRDGSADLSLNASASIEWDGTIVGYAWSTSGTDLGHGEILQTSLEVGTHIVNLIVTDDAGAIDIDSVVVTVLANAAPIANAGADFAVVDQGGDGVELVTLDASASSDSDGSIVDYSWSIAGVFQADGVSPVLSLTAGQHVIDLTVTDNDGATATDSVLVDVGNGTIQLSFPYTYDFESGSDFSGLPTTNTPASPFGGNGASVAEATVLSTTDNGRTKSYTADLSIPLNDESEVEIKANLGLSAAEQGTVRVRFRLTFVDANSNTSTKNTSWHDLSSSSHLQMDMFSKSVNNIAPGLSLSKVQIQVRQNDGGFPEQTLYIDDVIIGSNLQSGPVGPPANVAPTANAGNDQTVVDSDEDGSEMINLDASGSSDPDGSIVNYTWSNGGVILYTGSDAIIAVDLPVGTHTLSLTVTDDDGENSTDNVDITVVAVVNDAPTADAGVDQTITAADASIPESITLDGSASTDLDGTIVDYTWSNGGTVIASGTNPSATTDLGVGVHTLTLTVTDDDGASSSDTVVITIEAPLAEGGFPFTEDFESSSAYADLPTVATPANPSGGNGAFVAQAVVPATGSNGKNQPYNSTVSIPLNGKDKVKMTVTLGLGDIEQGDVRFRIRMVFTDGTSKAFGWQQLDDSYASSMKTISKTASNLDGSKTIANVQIQVRQHLAEQPEQVMYIDDLILE